jgi:P4 family phage/plasmid primase-like protien
VSAEAVQPNAPWIPELPESVSVPEAAALYAAAGWFVVPVDPETKNPGSRLGKGWQLQSTRDPSVIQTWWQRWPEASLALHVGRSGAVCLDVDDPAKLTQGLGAWLMPDDGLGVTPAQFQSTRVAEQGRGHYLFAAPAGAYGNSVAGFREAGLDGWGEVRGLNAVIVAQPSVHTKPGGRYQWLSSGTLPEVPAGLAELLRPPGAVAGSAPGSAELNDFLADLPGPEQCPVVQGATEEAVSTLLAMDPGGRHDYMLGVVQKLVRLGEQGHHGAAGALEETYSAFCTSKPDAGGTEYLDAVSGAVRNALANQTLPQNAGCCPSWLQDRWMQANGFTPPPPVMATADGVVIMGPWLEQAPQVRNGTGKFTYAALAETFAAEALYGRYRWAPGLKWLRWDGVRWERIPDTDVEEAARLWALGHLESAAHLARTSLEGQVDDTEVKAWLSVAKAAGLIRSVVQGARGVPGIRTDGAAFDRDPDILNCRSGVIHLPTGELWAPDPRRLVTKLAPVDYVPGARHPDWIKALEALPPDDREWFQLRLGQAITGHTPPDDLLVICQGGGKNAKSTLFDAVMSVLGDYHVQLADRVLTASPDAHPTELMDLRGARVATIEETPEARQLNVVRLKKTVGSSHITARYIAQDSVTYAATHTLFVSTNYRPIVAETDYGTWRRLALLRFPYTFLPAHKTRTQPEHRLADLGLRDRVKTDPAVHSAVLAWLLDGAWAWYASGKQMPAPTTEVEAQTDAWRYDSDTVHAYWAERLEPADGYAVLASDLLGDFNEWAARTKAQNNAWSDRTFKSRFGDHETTQLHGVHHRRYSHWAGEPLISRAASGYGMTSGAIPRDPVLWSGMRFQGSYPQPPTEPVDNPVTSGNTESAHDAHTTPAKMSSDLYVGTDRSSVRTVRETQDRTHVRPAPPVSPVSGSVTQGDNPQPPAQPVDKPKGEHAKPTKVQLANAEAKRLRVSAAAGPDVRLPAVVLRDGTVTEVTLGEAQTLLEGLPTLTVDVETSGHPIGHEAYELRLVQLGDDTFGVVLDPNDASQRDTIAHYLKTAPVLHAHSATADLVPLAYDDLADFNDAWQRMDDTVIRAKLHDPASTGADAGLKEISDHMLGPESASTPADEARKTLFKAAGWLEKPKPTTPPAKNGWHQVKPNCYTFTRYAGSDVLDTALVAKRLPPLPPHIYERERTAAHMVSRIALIGVPLDGTKVDQLHTEHTQARQEITETIQQRYGIDNPGSAQQVARTLTDAGVQLPRTKPSVSYPEGQPSVAEGVLEALKGQYDGIADALITDVLQYRHHATALGLFLEPYSQLVHKGDGRARPTVYTLGADTGRMSCVRPNFQQLPQSGGFRSIITTDPGMLQIGADFSSVEIRVAAEVSGDQVLMRMLDEGLDPHAMAADIVFGPDFTKAQRYMVKRGVFGRIYGGGLNTLAQQMGVPHYIAQQLIDAIDTLWPTLSAWSQEIKRAVQSGLMPTWTTHSGRLIHLPKDKAHAAPNYVIQGTARELLIDAMMLWRTTRWGASVMWPVHDEVDAHVPAAEAEDATATLVQCMETTLPRYGVRIIAEPSEPSPFWVDAA